MAAFFVAVKLWPNWPVLIMVDGQLSRRADNGNSTMHSSARLSRAKLGAAGALALVTLSFLPATADAAWWNPFRRDDPEPQQVQPLPAPPAAVAPVPPAEVGQPTAITPQAQPAAQQPAEAAPLLAQSDQGLAGPPPGSPQEMVLRIERLEGKLRTMTGQIEELQFRVRQLEAQLGGGQGAAAAAPGTAPGATAGAALSLDGSEAEMAMDGGGELPMDGGGLDPHGMVPDDDPMLGAPPAVLGQVPAEGPLDLSALAGDQVASLGPASGSPRTDYVAAYDLILSGDYQLAEAGIRQFLANYPDDGLAPDAQYWLGESLFTRGLYREAAIEFLAGYRSYPDSAKAPDTLLKLGLSLAGLGEREQACNTFSRLLQQYPDANNALLQRVQTEQANASC
jgi:tol-pal system protein YbgF